MEIRRLTPGDTAAVLRLCDTAGWNQTDRDVRRLLALDPDGCFAMCADGRVVGTATATTYGTDLAWVGMVLVDPSFRRRGVATALVEATLGYLRERGVATVKLDATPAGRPVYQRLGFAPEHVLERWAGNLPADGGRATGGAWADVADLDRAAFGADRGALLRHMTADTPVPLSVARGAGGGVTGYAHARPGTRAGYVGPVVSDDLPTAGELVRAAGAGLGGGAVFIDVDPGFPGAADLMTRLGFTRLREFVRMRLGPALPAGPARVFAIAGPDVG